MVKKVGLFFLAVACITGVLAFVSIRANSDLPEFVNKKLTDEEFQTIVSRNSPMTEYVQLVASADFPRTSSIKKITIHHTAGMMSLENVGKVFSDRDRAKSANYVIDKEGKVGLYVEECNRAWSSSSPENDDQAVTIEVTNDEVGGNWHVSSKSYKSLVRLCTDICKRNHIEKLVYTGDDTGTLTLHDMFADTSCPGPYLKSVMADIASEVNIRLNDK